MDTMTPIISSFRLFADLGGTSLSVAGAAAAFAMKVLLSCFVGELKYKIANN